MTYSSTIMLLIVASALATGTASGNATVTHSWVFKTSKSTGYVHMATIEQVPGGGPLAVAFQATRDTTEGDDSQSIYLKLSHDGGARWDAHTVLVKPGFPQAVWGPVLQWDEAGARMLCFFSASVPGNARGSGRSYPGGDIYVTRSAGTDLLANWSAPQRLLAFNDTQFGRGLVSKVTANKPAISADGRTWLLPFWQEPHTANETGARCAGVLRSADSGASWAPTAACLSDTGAGWLIENTLAFSTDGDLLMLFRTKAGFIWQARSADLGATWSAPNATALPNPNSKTFLTATQGGQLLLAYNPSSGKRDPLALARSADAGRTWEGVATLDEGGCENYAYPTTAVLNGTAVSVYSADIRTGIRLAKTTLEWA
eukprot:g5959.t1